MRFFSSVDISLPESRYEFYITRLNNISLTFCLTDPGDELQASHPLRDGKVVVEDIEDNPGFFRIRLYAVPHFQIEGMDINLSLVSQMPKAKA